MILPGYIERNDKQLDNRQDWSDLMDISHIKHMHYVIA